MSKPSTTSPSVPSLAGTRIEVIVCSGQVRCFEAALTGEYYMVVILRHCARLEHERIIVFSIEKCY